MNSKMNTYLNIIVEELLFAEVHDDNENLKWLRCELTIQLQPILINNMFENALQILNSDIFKMKMKEDLQKIREEIEKVKKKNVK